MLRAVAALALGVALVATATAAEWAPRMLLLDAALVGNDVIAVGERGVIVRSVDSARTWQRVASPTVATLTAVSFAPPPSDSRLGWAAGHDAIILGTTDAGRTWTVSYQGESLEDSFLDVVALDARRAIAVGAYGLYVSTADGGKTWTRRELGQDDFHLNRITRGPVDTLYLAGERGTLLRSDDQGGSWIAIPTPYEGSFFGILPLGPTALLAYGLRGHVYHSRNDGESWTAVTTPEPVLLATGLRLRSGLILLAGQARALVQSTDQGLTFIAASVTPEAALAELLELPDGGVLGVGEAGAIRLPKSP